MTPELVHQAVINASRKHMCKNEVIEFLQDKENEYSVYRQLLKGESEKRTAEIYNKETDR